MVLDPATGGYWLVAKDCGLFSFDATLDGSLQGEHITPAQPIVGVAAASDGGG
jgi:hypothetical protein